MPEILIQFITSAVITIASIIYLFCSKTVSLKQIKQVFSPDEACGVKLYKLNDRLLVWDIKFCWLYQLPILCAAIAILFEAIGMLLYFLVPVGDPSYLCLYIYIGLADVFNFGILLTLSERRELIRKKQFEPSWEELKRMSDE